MAPFQWHKNDDCEWAMDCDFYGNDFAQQPMAAEQAGSESRKNPECTHFTWAHGVCYMKKGPISKDQATYAPGMVSGIVNRGANPPVVGGDNRVGVGFGLIGPYRDGNSYGGLLSSLKRHGYTRLKTWSINWDWLGAVRATYGPNNVHVTVAIPNGELQAAAYDHGYRNGVLAALTEFQDIIDIVAVGNEPCHDMNKGAALPHLLPAFYAIDDEVHQRGLRMKVTVPFSEAILANTWPVEASVIRPEFQDMMKKLAERLSWRSSVFSINIYPFFGHMFNPRDINVEMATNGQLLAQTVRCVGVSLEKLGFGHLKVVIGETGWPTGGHAAATHGNARRYLDAVNDFARQGKVEAIYLFEAFDERGKHGAEVERHFGVYKEDGERKY